MAAAAAAVAVAGAVIAAAVRALRDGWYPVGDNAYFALRSRDVLTEHHPLLGTWTSASQTVGFDVNNPGPLLFDVLAVPAKIDPDLLPLGVAALVLGSIAIAALCASRAAGVRGVLGTLVASAGLQWAMGPELVVDPWQPHSLLFPFLALLVAVWAAWVGSAGSVLAVVALGSLVVQTHLSYAPLIALLGGSAAAAVVWRVIRHPPRRRHELGMLAGAVVLGLALWAQPLAEQVSASDRGNLSRLADVAGADRDRTVGARDGLRVAGTLLSPLPQWQPPSFEEDFAPRPDDIAAQPGEAAPPRLVLNGAPTTTVGLAAVLATLLVLAIVALVAHRRAAPALRAAAGVAAIAVVGAVVSTMALPVGVYGLPAHHVRWLWPVAIAVTTVLVAGALVRRTGSVLVAAGTVAMAVLALAPTHPEIGPTADGDAAPVIRALAPQLDALRDRGPFLLELEGLRSFEPYSIAVVLELDQRGVEIHVEDPGMVRQLGPAREATGDEEGRLFVWQGELGRDGRSGLQRVAYVASLDPQEAVELDRRTADLRRWLGSGEVRLTDLGQRAVRSGRIPDLASAMASGTDPFAAVTVDAFRSAAEDGYLVAPGRARELDRWVELRSRFVRRTVGVWVDAST